MSNIETTPLKESPQDADADTAGLIASFSDIKLTKANEGSTENMLVNSPSEPLEGLNLGLIQDCGRSTIEGSPVADHFRKRFDAKSTPLIFRCLPAVDETSPDNVSNDCTVATLKLPPPVLGADGSRSVVLINTASEEIVHDTGDHQENKLRTELIAGPSGCLKREALKSAVSWVSEGEIMNAALSDLLRVHERSYIFHLENKIKETKHIGSRSELGIPEFYAPSGYLDVDTPLSASSLESAKRFCGGAILAIEKVLNGANTAECPSAAFVIGRPPGHHAGPNGCVVSSSYWQRPDMASSGFCLLNTVGVAAAHARCRYSIGRSSTSQDPSQVCILEGHPAGSRELKIAIVDIDIHHGNGTEAIVRNLTPHTEFLPLPSSWAPVSIQSYKNWYNESDNKEVLFSSIHLYGGPTFYPCSGADTTPEEERDGNVINIALTPIGPGTGNNPKKLRSREDLTAKQRAELCAIASAELRHKVASRLIPKLKSFEPDLLLISAGFDAHYDDMYHYLNESDFHWLTEVLCDTCDRVVSVMEGGYSLKPVSITKSAPGIVDHAAVNLMEQFAIVPESPISKTSIAAGKGSRTFRTPSDKGSTQPVQETPDGGLVKAVLAHVCALAKKSKWVEKPK